LEEGTRVTGIQRCEGFICSNGNDDKQRSPLPLLFLLLSSCFFSDLEAQIVEQRERLLHDQEWKESIRESKATAVHELTRCLDKFRHLGFAFDATTTAAPNDPGQPAVSSALRYDLVALQRFRAAIVVL
jgi:hypothetical protein